MPRVLASALVATAFLAAPPALTAQSTELSFASGNFLDQDCFTDTRLAYNQRIVLFHTAEDFENLLQDKISPDYRFKIIMAGFFCEIDNQLFKSEFLVVR